MLREDLLNTLYAKRADPAEFNFETLTIPPIYNYISEYEIGKIYDITTSKKYSSKVDKKIQAIKDIMLPRGFVGFANGTNRMCFRYLENKNFVVKVPYKVSGIDNGFREYMNQQCLKPFVAKTFEVHPSGAISTHERVLPITNKEEYLSVIDDVFAMLTALMGKYALEDVGTKYFMNIGIRVGFGVVIIDYPELFELDGKKLYCNRPVYPNTKFPVCGGLIDFDAGFNTLICTTCGKEYPASALQKARENKLLIIEGDESMGSVKLRRRGQVVATSTNITNTIAPEDKPYKIRPDIGSVRIRKSSDTIQVPNEDPEVRGGRWFNELAVEHHLTQLDRISFETALAVNKISIGVFGSKEDMLEYIRYASERYSEAIIDRAKKREAEEEEKVKQQEQPEQEPEPVEDNAKTERPESNEPVVNEQGPEQEATTEEDDSAEELKTGEDLMENTCSIEGHVEPRPEESDTMDEQPISIDQPVVDPATKRAWYNEIAEELNIQSDEIDSINDAMKRHGITIQSFDSKDDMKEFCKNNIVVWHKPESQSEQKEDEPKNKDSESPEQENKKFIREEYVDHNNKPFVIPPGQDISKF